MKISVVIPCYRCSKTIEELYFRVKEQIELKLKLEYELIFINDSSPENDWEIIKKICSGDKKVKGINFSRNFGQHYAIIAGLDKSTGDKIVVMDGDLQDIPEEIEKLYLKSEEGYDIVLARREKRKDGFMKKFFSKMFYKVLSYLTETKQDATVANFGMYSKRAIKAVLSMNDSVKYFPTMIKWVGFTKSSINVEHGKRSEGEGAYSLKKRVNLAIEIMLDFSDRPLRMTAKLGLVISMFAVIYALYISIKAYLGIKEVEGWASLFVSIWFLSGLIIFSLGIVGIYIAKIFDEVKDRPKYIIMEIKNLEEN